MFVVYNDWFLKVKDNPLVHKDFEGCLYYKGFKCTTNGDILDVRHSDFYDEVTLCDLQKFIQHGFIEGADLIMYNRDISRSDEFKSKIETSYNDIQKFETLLKKRHKRKRSPYQHRKLITMYKNRLRKRIRNTRTNILEYLDRMFFYRARLKQYENMINDIEVADEQIIKY